MIRAIQRSVGALDNGWIGNQTLSDIAAKLGADCWPLNVELYGQPCIIARDIEPVNMSGPLPRNAISGSFSWQGQPCSILMRGGKVVRNWSCHYPRPESVLYKTTDGAVRIARVSSAAALGGVVWAVGGAWPARPLCPRGGGLYRRVLRRASQDQPHRPRLQGRDALRRLLQGYDRAAGQRALPGQAQAHPRRHVRRRARRRHQRRV